MGTFYQGITNLPRHIEERLLTFNVLQLCALVCEKPGPRWAGASDQYGPIQEIVRRWELKDLTRRIEDMHPEEPLLTYARVMTALGGNPAAEKEQKKKDDKVRAMIHEKTKPWEQDIVRTSLAGCLDMDSLKAVAAEHALPISAQDWLKVDGLANHGLKRMWVGNCWRTVLRRKAKEQAA